MVILGIDPGYAIIGYGVIETKGSSFAVRGYGAITTEAGTPFDDRLLEIYNGMNIIIEKYKPEALSIEQLFFTNNQKTGIDVAQARGVILLSAAQNRLDINEYTPLQVKQAVVGYGRALKPQVMEMTRKILHLPEVPKPDDTADALALAICHAHCCGSRIGRDLERQYGLR